MKRSVISVLERARRLCFAIPAFNVSTLEQIRVVAECAAKLRAPVIIETSEGEAELMTYRSVVAAVAAQQSSVKVPLILNADHHHSFKKLNHFLY